MHTLLTFLIGFAALTVMFAGPLILLPVVGAVTTAAALAIGCLRSTCAGKPFLDCGTMRGAEAQGQRER